MRKIIMFIFGIVALSVLVMASQWAYTVQLNKDNARYINETCVDLGYPPTQAGIEYCMAEMNEDTINEDRQDSDYSDIENLVKQVLNSPRYHKSSIYALTYLKDNGVYYYCQEAQDEVDTEICLWVENNGHDCYYCEGKHSDCMESCINDVWTEY